MPLEDRGLPKQLNPGQQLKNYNPQDNFLINPETMKFGLTLTIHAIIFISGLKTLQLSLHIF